MKRRSHFALIGLACSSAALAQPSPYSGTKGPDGALKFQCMPEIALLNLMNTPRFSENWAGCWGG